MQPDPMATDPASGIAPPESGEQGTTVCITCLPDGTYTVYVQEDQETGPEPGGEQGDGPQTVQSIDEALDAARQMLTAEMGEETQEPGSGDEPLSPDKAASYWQQMAMSRAKQKAAA